MSRPANTAFTPPVVLTVAGSDCSSGAGAQADLRAITALGGYAVTALTCVVSEVPGRVSQIQPLDKKIVLDQIRVLGESFPISAAKTGMLGGRAQIEAAVAGLSPLVEAVIPLVVDPVMVATSGDRLLEKDALRSLIADLFPLATLITPNMDEAAVLLGREIKTLKEMEEAARELSQRHGCSVLLKGGHLGGTTSTDVLFHAQKIHRLESMRIFGVSTHGTGCMLSAAVAANLAAGNSLVNAVKEAKTFISTAIGGHFRWDMNGTRVASLNPKAAPSWRR